LRKSLTFLAVFLACAGVTMIVVSQRTHRWAPPPVPPAAARGGSAISSTAGLDRAPQQGAHPYQHPDVVAPAPPHLDRAPMRRSEPATVRIPVIGVDARIIPLGLGAYGTVEVPSLNTPDLTSWFDGGVTPGQIGPAVLLGHVDSAVTGPAVFYRLGDLRPGNLVYVTRADHRTAVFQVSSVNLFSQWNFPDKMIYGTRSRPVLRLITCGGDFDAKTHLYLDRTVAFASYVGQQRSLPVREHVEDLLPVPGQFRLADAVHLGEPREIGGRGRRYRPQRRVVEDHVGGHALLLRGSCAPCAQLFEKSGSFSWQLG
jgi:hypothetical protein